MWLVLFDVDKTLFMTSDPLMGQATTEAIETVWGRRLAHDAIKYVDHPGQTATRITRLLLRADGLSETRSTRDRRVVPESLGPLPRAAVPHRHERVARRGGSRRGDREIEHRALLTGNPEPVARARMEIIGLDHLFPRGQGAFGCEAEDRADLIGIARQRAGDWPAEETVAVGDTPADISGARAAGIHVIGFGSTLEGADAVIEHMSELPDALERLSAAT